MRNKIDPSLKLSFVEVYNVISQQPGGKTQEILTTGGVLFVAESKITRDGRRYISLPHSNRIYEGDWGYKTNSMGTSGQRIAHYSVPLDKWALSSMKS